MTFWHCFSCYRVVHAVDVPASPALPTGEGMFGGQRMPTWLENHGENVTLPLPHLSPIPPPVAISNFSCILRITKRMSSKTLYRKPWEYSTCLLSCILSRGPSGTYLLRLASGAWRLSFCVPCLVFGSLYVSRLRGEQNVWWLLWFAVI